MAKTNTLTHYIVNLKTNEQCTYHMYSVDDFKKSIDQGYPSNGYGLIPNDEFTASMEYYSIFKGRSAVDTTFRRMTDGRLFTFNFPQFKRIIKLMEKGIVTGKFKVYKQGANYSCMLVE